MNSICPWCQTEIVWDQEIGPEDQCPHCLNELEDYRSVELNIAPDAKEPDMDREDNWEDSDGESDELGPDFHDQQMVAYKEAVEQYLDAQEEVLECIHCRDYMVYAGVQNTAEQQFTPLKPTGIAGSFLKAPYSVKVHVCPSCFQVSFSLSDDDRLKVMSLRKTK